MLLELTALVVFFGLMVVFWFYVQKSKHPRTEPVAAYLIFIVIFSTVAMLLFVFLSYLAGALGLKSAVNQPFGAAAFMAIVCIPAFFAANWQLRRPPRKGPDIE